MTQINFTSEDWARIRRDYTAWWEGALDRPLLWLLLALPLLLAFVVLSLLLALPLLTDLLLLVGRERGEADVVAGLRVLELLVLDPLLELRP